MGSGATHAAIRFRIGLARQECADPRRGNPRLLCPDAIGALVQAGVDLSGLEAVLVGGAPIPRILVERAVHRDIPLFTTYGCTEMASQVSTTRPNERDDFESLSTAGHVLEGH